MNRKYPCLLHFLFLHMNKFENGLRNSQTKLFNKFAAGEKFICPLSTKHFDFGFTYHMVLIQDMKSELVRHHYLCFKKAVQFVDLINVLWRPTQNITVQNLDCAQSNFRLAIFYFITKFNLLKSNMAPKMLSIKVLGPYGSKNWLTHI